MNITAVPRAEDSTLMLLKSTEKSQPPVSQKAQRWHGAKVKWSITYMKLTHKQSIASFEWFCSFKIKCLFFVQRSVIYGEISALNGTWFCMGQILLYFFPQTLNMLTEHHTHKSDLMTKIFSLEHGKHGKFRFSFFLPNCLFITWTRLIATVE